MKRSLINRLLILVAWLTPAAACVYALVLVRRLTDIAGQLTWNADYVSQMAMAESAGSGGLPARAVIIQIGYFWLDLATYLVPAHRLLWEFGPAAMGLATVALVAWSAGRLAGRFAGLLAASLAVAASPLVLSTELAQAYHGSTWFAAAALGAYLCWLMTTGASRGLLVAVSSVVALVVGLATASDPLLIAVGDLPFAAAIVVAWRTAPPATRSPHVVAGAASLVSAAGLAAAASLIERLAGFGSSFPRGLTHVVTPAHLAGNMHQFITGVFEVAGMPHGGSALGLVLGLLLVAGVLVPLAQLVVSVRRPVDQARFAVIAYWSASAVFVAGAFILSDVPADFLENSARYLVSLFFVGAAAVPMWAAASPRRAAALALPAAVLILANAAAVEHDATTGAFEPSFSFALDEPISFLEAHGLTHGYAAYDEASPMSWKSGFALHVYPVTELFVAPGDLCGPPSPGRVCPYAYNSFSSWYEGKGGPTFILVDPYMVRLGQPPPDALDTPTGVYQVGRFRIYVYPDDVASHMGMPERFTRPLI